MTFWIWIFKIFCRILQRKKFSPFVKWATLILLFIVNLLNYMDRFTIVGVLSAVQQEFDIGQTKAALLQTVFLVSYMALSPIVGYLGKFLVWVWAWFGLFVSEFQGLDLTAVKLNSFSSKQLGKAFATLLMASNYITRPIAVNYILLSMKNIFVF